MQHLLPQAFTFWCTKKGGEAFLSRWWNYISDIVAAWVSLTPAVTAEHSAGAEVLTAARNNLQFFRYWMKQTQYIESLLHLIVLLFFRFSIMVMVINDTVISTLNDYKSKSHFIHFENFEKSLQRFAWLIMHLMDRENQINVSPNAGNFWSFLQRLLILHGCDFIRYCTKFPSHFSKKTERNLWRLEDM